MSLPNTWHFPPKSSTLFPSMQLPPKSITINRKAESHCCFSFSPEMEVEGDYFPIIDFPTNGITNGSDPFRLSNASFDSSIPRQFFRNSLTHESLLENSELFYQKLCDFCEFSGRKPIGLVGDKVVDLHVLYKEVTARGGLDQVTKDGTWEEVASALNFTGRVDDRFLLQECYIKHLYDFEHMYFLGTEREPAVPEGDPGVHIGNIVRGVIYTKFNGGYLITVPVGSEKLSGLLYDFEECVAEQFAVIPGLMVDIGPVSDPEPVRLQFQVGCSKSKLSPVLKKSEAMKQFPQEQRKARNAYEIFFHEQNDRQNTTPQGNIRKTVIAAWKSLSKSERLPYIEKSLKNREEHKRSGLSTLRKPRNAYQIFFSEQCDRLKDMQRAMKEKVRDAWKRLPESERLPYIEQSKKEKEEKKKERINHGMVSDKEQQNMQSRSSVEYRPYFLETSIGDHHFSFETGFGTNEFFVRGKPMDPFNVCLMETANQLGQMDWDFCGQLDLSI